MSDFEPKFTTPESRKSPKSKAQDPITAWVEDMRDPSPEVAARIDRAFEMAVTEVTGKPIRRPEELRRSRAARDARLINRSNP